MGQRPQVIWSAVIPIHPRNSASTSGEHGLLHGEGDGCGAARDNSFGTSAFGIATKCPLQPLSHRTVPAGHFDSLPYLTAQQVQIHKGISVPNFNCSEGEVGV